MAVRDLSLSRRVENVRSTRPILPPVRFSLDEIHTHFCESMDSIKDQFKVADELLGTGNEIGCKVIWRSQVVLAESLLDFYIHEMSKYCLFRMFTGEWEKSEKYARIMVPMSSVEVAVAAVESKEWFFLYLNSKFRRDVFLSVESMRDQLNLIGIGFADTMETAFPSQNKNEAIEKGKRVVEELFKRRNEIAHQNDRSHESAEQRDITKDYVEVCFSHIESIVSAIHGIAVNKDL